MAFEADTPIANMDMFNGEIAYHYRAAWSIDRPKQSITRGLILLNLFLVTGHLPKNCNVHIQQVAGMASDKANAISSGKTFYGYLGA